MSKSIAKKADRFGTLDEYAGTFTIQAYLLTQFGKNYAVDNETRFDAGDLMEQVHYTIKMIQHMIGGGFIYLDVEKTENPNDPDDKPYEKLINIYRNKAGYVAFRERHSQSDGKDYVMMIKAV